MLFEFLDSLLETAENITKTPNTTSERQEKQRDFHLDPEIKKEVEVFFTDISQNLGDLSRDFLDPKNIFQDLDENIQTTIKNPVDAVNYDRFLHLSSTANRTPQLADHLITYRLGFTHHGLYIGNNQVIHYEKGSIHYDSMENFTKNMDTFVLPEEESPLRYSPEEVINRGKSRLGEDQYHLIFNNCEHFVRWCRYSSDP